MSMDRFDEEAERIVRDVVLTDRKHSGYNPADYADFRARIASALREKAREHEEWKARAEKAEGVVAKLPKTADGKPVFPGMAVWTLHNGDRLPLDKPERLEAERLGVRGPYGLHGLFLVGGFNFNTADCYSTEAAAIAAKEAAH